MAPVIHIVRHAQGDHNIAPFGEGIHDPLLTEKGKQQSQQLCEEFPYHGEIDALMASPMKRTIQTCQIAFKPVVEREQKILVMPLAQESSNEPMDTGSSQSEIKDMFGDLVDISRLDLFPYWYRNIGIFDVSAPALIERARKLRSVLRDRQEKNIVLVTHGAFAHAITGNINHDGEQTTRAWNNAEYRSYRFIGDDEDAQLVELEESKNRRPNLDKQDSGFVVSVDGPRKTSLGEVK